jgi:hypothetical protein
MTARDFFLYESQLSPERARMYTKLAEFDLRLPDIDRNPCLLLPF